MSDQEYQYTAGDVCKPAVLYVYDIWCVTEVCTYNTYVNIVLKGTVSPVLSRLKVVLLNIVESGEVPLVI